MGTSSTLPSWMQTSCYPHCGCSMAYHLFCYNSTTHHSQYCCSTMTHQWLCSCMRGVQTDQEDRSHGPGRTKKTEVTGQDVNSTPFISKQSIPVVVEDLGFSWDPPSSSLSLNNELSTRISKAPTTWQRGNGTTPCWPPRTRWERDGVSSLCSEHSAAGKNGYCVLDMTYIPYSLSEKASLATHSRT